MASASATAMVLGEGTYGRVVKYFSKRHCMFVARKCFMRLVDYQAELSWFTTIEARGAHKNIVTLLGKVQEEAQRKLFIDMELANCTLHRIGFNEVGGLTKCPTLPNASAVRSMVADCLHGLAFLHDTVGVAHNDIKPDNVLVFGNNQYKLCDFGMCSYLQTEKKFGTLGYTAPEFYIEAEEDHTGRHDVFSMGVTLYEILEGNQPSPIPKKILQTYSQWNREKKKDQRENLKKSFFEQATRFYAFDYKNVVLTGRNATSVGYGVVHLLADMVSKNVGSRPRASECLPRLRFLEQVEKNLPAQYRVTTVQQHNNNATNFGTAAASQAFRAVASLQTDDVYEIIQCDSPEQQPVQFAIPAVPQYAAAPLAQPLPEPVQHNAANNMPGPVQLIDVDVMGFAEVAGAINTTSIPRDILSRAYAAINIPDVTSSNDVTSNNSLRTLDTPKDELEVRFPVSCTWDSNTRTTVRMLLANAVLAAKNGDKKIKEDRLDEDQIRLLRRLQETDMQRQLYPIGEELLKVIMFNPTFNQNRMRVFQLLTGKSENWWRAPHAKRLRNSTETSE